MGMLHHFKLRAKIRPIQVELKMHNNQDAKPPPGDILVVDDETTNLKMLKEILWSEGYQVRPADHPLLAIDSALAQPPDLILLDVKMPEMDGYEVCKRFKQNDRTCDIPIIFISALQDAQDKVLGFEAGGVDFISKPFQAEEVLARVRTHMELRKMQINLEELVTQRSAELAESEAKYRGLVDNSMVGVFTTTINGRLTFVNDAMARMFDFESTELMIAKGSLERWKDPKDRKSMLAELQEHGRVTNYEAETVTHTGRNIHVLFSAKLQDDKISGMLMDITARRQAEEDLRESRDFLEHLTSAVPDAIFSIKMPERTINWADDSFNVLGYEPEEYIGQSTKKFYANPDDYDSVGHLQQDAIRKGDDMIRTEVMVLRKDGRAIPAELTATFYREEGKLSRITALVRDMSERKQAEQKVIEYQDRLKALASQLTIVEEKERRAIAAELHDYVGQSLALARMQLASECKSTADSKLADKLENISATLLKCIKDTKKLQFELSSPTMHKMGLSSAICEWLEIQIESRDGLKTEFIDNIPDNRSKTLDPNMLTILFRNVRELVVNVIKHARANKVSVRLEDRSPSIRIIVEDDGIGFDPRAVTQARSKTCGFGLFSIEELMTDLGGSFRIVSEPGKGCTAILSAPFSVDNSQKKD